MFLLNRIVNPIKDLKTIIYLTEKGKIEWYQLSRYCFYFCNGIVDGYLKLFENINIMYYNSEGEDVPKKYIPFCREECPTVENLIVELSYIIWINKETLVVGGKLNYDILYH